MLNVTESIGVFRRRYLIQIAHLNYEFFCLISSYKDTTTGLNARLYAGTGLNTRANKVVAKYTPPPAGIVYAGVCGTR